MALIQQGERHRANRNYADADALRDRLLAEGIQLYDTPEGVRWRRLARTGRRSPAHNSQSKQASPGNDDGGDHACGLVRCAEVLVGTWRVEGVPERLAGVDRA